MTKHYWRLSQEEREAYDTLPSDLKSEMDRRLEDQFYQQSTGKKLAEEVARMLNGGHDDEIPWFIRGMACEHRTLQQFFTGLCVKWLEHLAELEPSRYDGRNEASVKMAKWFIANIGTMKHLPLV